MASIAGPGENAPKDRGTLVLWAWGSVLLIPAFFVLSMAAGYVLYELSGYKPENDDAPLWVDLLVDVPVLFICLVPCLAAVRFGSSARVAGSRSGLPAVAIGALAGLGFVILVAIDLLVR